MHFFQILTAAMCAVQTMPADTAKAAIDQAPTDLGFSFPWIDSADNKLKYGI